MTDKLSRRLFMGKCVSCGLGVAFGTLPVRSALAGRRPARVPWKSFKEAFFWERLDGGRVRCLTCPNRCERGEGEITLCRTRICRDGKLWTMVYGRPCEVRVDSLAKNPLYHVAPGSEAVGAATAGCNLTCKYCQNWEISQKEPWKTKWMDVPPGDLVKKAKSRGLKWLTFSYTEPTAYYEYAIDTAKLAKRNGLRVAMCTAGFISERPLRELMRVVDAFSVTLKGYSKKFYTDVCGCNLDDVWKSIIAIERAGKWMEMVNLIVPGMNDESAGLKEMARSVARLSRNIPLHFLRFAPAYKLKHLQPTPVKTLERARSIALKEGLKFVYIDLSGHEAANTYCPKCGKAVIERAGFTVIKNVLKRNRCPQCSTLIPGVFPR